MIKCRVEGGSVDFPVTFYSRAGDTIAGGQEYNIEYSINGGSTYNYVAGPLNSTSCTQHGTYNLPSGALIKITRDIGGQDLFYNFNDNSATCPVNNNDVCGGSGIFPTAAQDVAITVWVDGNGDFEEC